MFALIKALLPFLGEAIFGKDDPLEVLNRNKTSSVLAVTAALLAVIVVALFYSNVKMFEANEKLSEGIPPPQIIQVEASVTDALILEHLQRLEIKIMALQESCKKAQSKETVPTNPTEKLCE